MDPKLQAVLDELEQGTLFVKNQATDGQMTVARSDIYGGRIVPFVPFTKLEGEQIVGTHNN